MCSNWHTVSQYVNMVSRTFCEGKGGEERRGEGLNSNNKNSVFLSLNQPMGRNGRDEFFLPIVVQTESVVQIQLELYLTIK